MHCGSCRGGVGHSGVNGENNRCYSHLSPMQGWGGVSHVGVGGVGHSGVNG